MLSLVLFGAKCSKRSNHHQLCDMDNCHGTLAPNFLCSPVIGETRWQIHGRTCAVIFDKFCWSFYRRIGNFMICEVVPYFPFLVTWYSEKRVICLSRSGYCLRNCFPSIASAGYRVYSVWLLLREFYLSLEGCQSLCYTSDSDLFIGHWSPIKGWFYVSYCFFFLVPFCFWFCWSYLHTNLIWSGALLPVILMFKYICSK